MAIPQSWRTVFAHAARSFDCAAPSQPARRPTLESAPNRPPGPAKAAGRDANRRARTADLGIGVEVGRTAGVADRADFRLYGLSPQQAGARGRAARFPPLRAVVQPPLHGPAELRRRAGNRAWVRERARGIGGSRAGAGLSGLQTETRV